MKVCSKCLRELDDDKFYKGQASCKECQRKQNAKKNNITNPAVKRLLAKYRPDNQL